MNPMNRIRAIEEAIAKRQCRTPRTGVTRAFQAFSTLCDAKLRRGLSPEADISLHDAKVTAARQAYLEELAKAGLPPDANPLSFATQDALDVFEDLKSMLASMLPPSVVDAPFDLRPPQPPATPHD